MGIGIGKTDGDMEILEYEDRTGQKSGRVEGAPSTKNPPADTEGRFRSRTRGVG